jgi:SAM-dependent methyltransferase
MALSQFVREYRIVRRAEGWGSPNADYYRALPYTDLTGRFREIWRIRARSYDTFLVHVLQPIEQSSPGCSLDLLDLGAGNGWLSHRLAQRGHRILAVDLLDDPLDGLRALRQYDAHTRALLPVMAEFDHLPLPERRLDMAIFNASLHYSTDYRRTLDESLRVLKPRGTLVILDSPMYSDPTSGARMVREREARFASTYGFASNALPSEHFLTPARLNQLGAELGLDWRVHMPHLDARTALTRRINGLRARREPARFPVIAARAPW